MTLEPVKPLSEVGVSLLLKGSDLTETGVGKGRERGEEMKRGAGRREKMESAQ